MGSKLPDDLKWSEAALALMEGNTDKTSVKAVCTTITKNSEAKDKKEACMSTVVDLATWTKGAAVFFPEPYLVTLFPVVMALCADKDKKVQIKAQEVRLPPPDPARAASSRPRPTASRLGPPAPRAPRAASPRPPPRPRRPQSDVPTVVPGPPDIRICCRSLSSPARTSRRPPRR